MQISLAPKFTIWRCFTSDAFVSADQQQQQVQQVLIAHVTNLCGDFAQNANEAIICMSKAKREMLPTSDICQGLSGTEWT